VCPVSKNIILSLAFLSFLTFIPLRADEIHEVLKGKTFSRYILQDSLQADTVFAAAIMEKNSGFYDLNRNGVIYRGLNIDAGSGVGVISGFSLELNGRISENVDVSAYVSDDNLAVSEEGSTEALSNIENIHIQFRHPNFLTRMGDYDYSYDDGEFGSLSRKVSGVYANARIDNHYTEAFLSAEKEENQTAVFSGMEGVLGPYIISGNNSRAEIVKNSETVYLNGREMKQGDEYFFDFETSELYFRHGNLIREGDRITVDYRSVKDDYERISYALASHNMFLNDKVGIKLHYFSEKDNREKPLNFDMNTDIRTAMESAGSVNSIRIPGYELSESGDYDLLAPDSTHFVYSGSGKGSYKIRFSYFEDGGEYDLSYDSTGTAIFVYDPLNGGSYLPELVVETPGSYSRIHGTLSYKEKYFESETEIIGSDMDRNQYYSDDSDFEGMGAAQKLVFRTDEGKAGIFRIALSGKHYNSELVVPSRLYDPATENDIDYEEKIKGGDFFRYGSEISHKYKEYTNNRFNFTRTESENDIYENSILFRSSGNFGDYSYRADIELKSLSEDSLEIQKDTYYFSNSFRRGSAVLSPFLRNRTYRTIDQNEKSGTDEMSAGGIVEYFFKDFVDLSNSTEYMVKSDIINEIREEYLRRTANILKLSNRTGTVFNSEMTWTRAVNNYADKDSSDSNYDLLNLKANYNKNSNYRFNLEYETEISSYIPKVRTYYSVDEGTGSYILVDGEYFPDDFGNYDFFVNYSGSPVNLTGVKLDFRSFFDPDEVESRENILYWLSRFDVGQDIIITERSKNARINDIMFLNLSEFQNDSTVKGLIESRTVIHFLRKARNSFEYSYNFRKNILKEYQNYSENTNSSGHYLSYRNRSGTFTHKISGRASTYEKFSLSGAYRTDDIRSSYISYTFRHDPDPNSNYSLTFEYGSEYENERELGSESYKFSPALSIGVYDKGVVRAGMDIIQIVSDKPTVFSMNSGMGQGRSYKWNMSADHEFGKDISGSLSYFGRKLSYDKKPFHEMRIEFRMNL
jgi:hypothetical protein